MLGELGLADATFSDADFGVAGVFLGYLNQGAGQAGIVGGIVVSLVAVYGSSFVLHKRAKQSTQVGS